ncbi:MAG TPA: tetratricopeptide repeat protein [Candidatus Sulfotelmatobacter sp.]|nr:tetratricopeptide repeat protein [Candidatus Sulfotelmatobacter sp.]
MSSARIKPGLASLLLMAAVLVPCRAQNSAPTTPAKPRGDPASDAGESPQAHAALIFQHGQEALNHGRLDEAERDFRQILALDPQAGGAFANLGVVYMRRKQWSKAIETLHKAEHLMPQVAGIRLNIGLAYYRQNQFLLAIPPFKSVVREQPDALQPRYLLGQCYFFAERWAEAADTLEPLWAQESNQPLFLYMLSMSAHKAGKKELDEQAWSQLLKTTEADPEFQLLMGKEHLQLEQYDIALSELQAAAAASPKLPFVHFNLGLTYLKKQDYEHARDEFLKDAAVEPDLALNYDELGEVYSLMQQDDEAEKSYRKALRRDPRLASSQVGLAKLYQREEKYPLALAAIDAAGKLDPDRTDIHYLRGQVLVHMGRKTEGQKELEAAVRIDNQRRAERQKQVETGTVPSPELLQPETPQ